MSEARTETDYVGCPYETAYKNPRQLEDEGVVESQKVANARVWLTAGNGE